MPSNESRDRPETTMTADRSVILYATFTASAGNAATVAALLGEYAVAVRREPGNVLFEASRNAEDPESFFVYEEYADEVAFQAHLNAPYGASFNASLAPLIVEPQSRLTFLRRA